MAEGDTQDHAGQGLRDDSKGSEFPLASSANGKRGKPPSLHPAKSTARRRWPSQALKWVAFRDIDPLPGAIDLPLCDNSERLLDNDQAFLDISERLIDSDQRLLAILERLIDSDQRLLGILERLIDSDQRLLAILERLIDSDQRLLAISKPFCRMTLRLCRVTEGLRQQKRYRVEEKEPELASAQPEQGTIRTEMRTSKAEKSATAFDS